MYFEIPLFFPVRIIRSKIKKFHCSVYINKIDSIVQVQDHLRSVHTLRDCKGRVGVHVTLFGIVCHCLVAMFIKVSMRGLKGEINP
jgi:hypothetical protein